MKKKLLSLLLVFSMILPGTISLAYWDVDYSDPISEGIDFIDRFDEAYNSDILSGFPDGSFRPYDFLTREQVAKIFTVYIGYSPNNYYPMQYNPFWDIDSYRWSYYHILDLASIGIINGYPDGSFGPDGYITRGELAQMLYSLQFHFTKDANWYYDYYWNPNINYVDLDYHWAEHPIWVMSCVVDTDFFWDTYETFYPDEPVTRIEAAYMIGKTIYFNHVYFDYYPDKYS